MKQRQRTVYRGHNIGFVFQAYNLIPALSATENVAIPLLLNGYNRKKALEKARELLVRVGLEEKLKSLPTQLIRRPATTGGDCTGVGS